MAEQFLPAATDVLDIGTILRARSSGSPSAAQLRATQQFAISGDPPQAAQRPPNPRDDDDDYYDGE